MSHNPSSSHQQLNYGTTAWFVIAHLVALIAPFYYTTPGAVLVGIVLFYVSGMLGITLGYHRLLTHRSFKAPRWLERTLATCGMLALQRSPLEWVSTHRMHHAGVDTAKDPHDASRGFWWSHIGWMCFRNPSVENYPLMRKFARDIAADPYLHWMTSHKVQAGFQVALGLILLALGSIPWVVWGIFVRVVFLYHVTWFVNSASHMFGYRHFDSKDRSTNCWWVGLLAFGEGWHNNHHTHQESARMGFKWFEFDQTWQVIKLLRALGLATDVKDLSWTLKQGQKVDPSIGCNLDPRQEAGLPAAAAGGK